MDASYAETPAGVIDPDIMVFAACRLFDERLLHFHPVDHDVVFVLLKSGAGPCRGKGAVWFTRTTRTVGFRHHSLNKPAALVLAAIAKHVSRGRDAMVGACLVHPAPVEQVVLHVQIVEQVHVWVHSCIIHSLSEGEAF